MHGLAVCLLWSQLIPTGATQTYCTLRICFGDEVKNSKGLGEKYILKEIFSLVFLTEMLNLQGKFSPHARATCTDFIYVHMQFGGESQICRSSIVGFKEINKNKSKQLVETIMLFTESLADCTESYENNPFNQCVVSAPAKETCPSKSINQCQ